MDRRIVRRLCQALAIALVALSTSAVLAAPRIDKLSLRGLQAGGITTLVIEGAGLAPEPRLLFSAPQASYTIKPGATAKRMEVDFTVDGSCPAGIYLLRAASAGGVSPAVALGVDNLPQIAFSPEIQTLDVALTGSLTGSNVLTTTFSGKKGQEVLVEVESRRLGSKLEPVVHVYDARHTQLAWSRGLPSIAGDARCEVTLPADGEYTIELHDAVFRGAEPGFFRLKVGKFLYADLAYPLGAQEGVESSFEFTATNLPEGTKAKAKLETPAGLARLKVPAPWPAETPLLSGSRPAVIASDHAEIVEAAPGDKLQEVPQAPVAINGRITAPGEQDRYRLAVTAGQTLRFDVLARRAGSPLDAVLSIQNEQGAELANNDDRPGSSDPGLEFKVPDGTSAVVLAVRDLRGDGGDDFLYRVSIAPAGQPSFSLSLPVDRVHVPRDGAALVRVLVDRAEYGGPIDLSFPEVPSGVSITGNSIPAGATEALVTLSAPGLSPAQSLTRVLGTSAAENVSIKRLARPPENPVSQHQPWLGEELAVAVTTPPPITLVWDVLSSDVVLARGAALPVKLRLQRAEGAKGAVRLSLLTTQKMPRKKVKENNSEKEVDDVARALRFEGAPTIAADASEIDARIIVPGDLPEIAYDLAIQAELLRDDNKSVAATAVTPARRLKSAPPATLELATAAVEARAGLGETGKVSGKIKRAAGFSLPVNITLKGLPEGLSAPTVTLVDDQTDFEFPLSFPFGTAAGDLKDVEVSAISLTDPKDPKSVIQVGTLPLAVKVVPGEAPPEKPAEEKAETSAEKTPEAKPAEEPAPE
ncbi:MAG: hypothetical protein DWQ37_17835 [Planctomycetota bacterium]|mgnify:CR=1 FL=1|nr:MAG: hypothetical protein DWQ37_17835 [Planctomycetota bacterium]